VILWSESARGEAKFIKQNLDIGSEWNVEKRILHKKCGFLSLGKVKT